MCFQEAIDAVRGKETDEERNARNAQEAAVAEQKAQIEGQARREKQMKDAEMAQARRDAIAASEKRAADDGAETPEQRKRKQMGLSSLRINKATGLGGPVVGTGLVVG